jgi:protease-4
MDADRILAGEATLTGSIGVFAMLPTFERSLEKLGVHIDGVGTTALSGELTPARTMGETGREVLQQSVEYEYEQFISRVASARQKTVEAIDEVAQGRVWSGRDALTLGLVDEIGGYRDAIDRAAELAGLGSDFEVVYYDTEFGISEALGFRLRSALARHLGPLIGAPLGPQLPASVQLLAEEAQRLSRLSDPRHVYAYCFACSLD